MRRVKVHKHAGVLSAYGLVLADVVNEQQEAWIHKFDGLIKIKFNIFKF
jgi:N-methylhydantoinase A/oxoprolinase/acetone carboxylase beta subunit